MMRATRYKRRTTNPSPARREVARRQLGQPPVAHSRRSGRHRKVRPKR